MSSYIPNNRYKWRKSVIALVGDIWTPLSWFMFLIMTTVIVFMLMSVGPVVWMATSSFSLPFLVLLAKVVYDWTVDSYEIEGSWLKATQRTSLQTLHTDQAPLTSVRNVDMKLEGILGETFGLVGDVIVQVEGMGIITMSQVAMPQSVRNTLVEASEYWAERHG